ncbi:MAG: hypothetical protein IT442_16310 [Phycisphaeraceae bacterium]|nr:hypothetical protein [Phycisphaeraceae bacterium]
MRRFLIRILSTCVILAIFVMVVLIILSGHAPRADAARDRVRQMSATRGLAVALNSYALDHDGHGPVHSIEMFGLYTDTDPDYCGFVLPASDATPDAILVDSMTFRDFVALPQAKRDQHQAAMAAAMPKNVIAHRLGNFVFTYHGLDFRTAPPEAWTIILHCGPQKNWPHPIPLCVGCVNGRLKQFEPEAFPHELETQNRLRATLSLAPLPDPRTVTHDHPAVAPPLEPEPSQPPDVATQPQSP